MAGAALVLSGCVSAEPGVVARAVDATLTAVLTPTPIVVVVTAVGGPRDTIVTVTPAPSAAPLPTATPRPAATRPAPTAIQPTVTLSPTATLSPTLTAVPTPTTTPGVYGRLVFSDDFSQPATWDLGNDATSSKSIANGALSVTVNLTDRYVVLFKLQSVPDVYLQTTGQAPACHTRDRYGLVFRVRDGQNYYLFDVDCDGRYRLAKMVDGNLTPLVDWTANAAVNVGAGAVNNLTVRADGNEIDVSANGHSLAKVTDATFRVGGFGFYVGSGLTVPYTANFDMLKVWQVLP